LSKEEEYFIFHNTCTDKSQK